MRFLLGLSAEDEAFNRMLTSPLSSTSTRLHVFLLAPASFVCRGWTRHRAWKAGPPPQSTLGARPLNDDDDANEPSDAQNESAGDTSKEEYCQMKVDSLPADNDNDNDNNDDDFDTRRMKKLQARALQREQRRSSSTSQQGRATSQKRTRRSPVTASFVINTSKIEEEAEETPSETDLDRVGDTMEDPYWFTCKVTPKGVSS